MSPGWWVIVRVRFFEKKKREKKKKKTKKEPCFNVVVFAILGSSCFMKQEAFTRGDFRN